MFTDTEIQELILITQQITELKQKEFKSMVQIGRYCLAKTSRRS
jgi:hypothetical protein